MGSNANGVPHLRQNPDVRPGSPSRPRPTGSSQFPQYRRLSGTDGSVISASDGSRNGIVGIPTSPAPSRLRTDEPVRDVAVLVDDSAAIVAELWLVDLAEALADAPLADAPLADAPLADAPLADAPLAGGAGA